MRRWKHHLELFDIWSDDDMPCVPEGKALKVGPPYNKRDLIVARIKALPHYIEDHEDERFDEDLWWIVDEMGDVDTADYFDLTWDAFYDWADANSVWVNVHSLPKRLVPS